MATRTEHVLLLGASGATGLVLIKYHLSFPESSKKPYLTLYVRPSSISKLLPVLSESNTSSTPAPKIRIAKGGLDDKSALTQALSANSSFPRVTTVISLLGAYFSLYHFLTRTTPTPITMAFNTTIVPTLTNLHIPRILVLSTLTGFPVPSEQASKSWGWWLQSLAPRIMIPQGSAEMKGVAEAVMDNSGQELVCRHGLEATVFRVPFLNDAEDGAEARTFVIGEEGATENQNLSRGPLVRWLLGEVEEGKWIGRAPLVTNP